MKFIKALLIVTIYYSLTAFNCDNDCISVNHNIHENHLMVSIEGTTSGEVSTISLSNVKGEVLLFEEIKLQNERTIYYIDLNQNIIEDGEYQLKIDKMTHLFSLKRK